MSSTTRATADRPTVAVSMGDPVGIGPEIIVKALVDEDLRRRARFVVYGQRGPLEQAAAAIATPLFRGVGAGGVELVEVGGSDADGAPGPSAEGGLASFAAVEAAIAAARLPVGDPGRADAIVTAPIAKASWDLAGLVARHGFPGHTELLADRFGVRRAAMLFVGPALRVILVTIHIPLARVAAAVTAERVLDAIELGHRACVELGVASPRIAVCGLNPHAGEGGLLGEEDGRVIAPAVGAARAQGIDATGPFPGDAVFLDAAAPPAGKGRYDLVVAMYHDQGLIPVKLLDRERAVNVTVGLPTIRTSPAHGTAFDIAGKNVASEASMRAAIELALAMVDARRRRQEA